MLLTMKNDIVALGLKYPYRLDIALCKFVNSLTEFRCIHYNQSTTSIPPYYIIPYLAYITRYVNMEAPATVLVPRLDCLVGSPMVDILQRLKDSGIACFDIH